MKQNDHPNPADIMNEKITGYIYEPDETDDIIFVLEKHLIRVPFESLTIKSRDEAI